MEDTIIIIFLGIILYLIFSRSGEGFVDPYQVNKPMGIVTPALKQYIVSLTTIASLTSKYYSQAPAGSVGAGIKSNVIDLVAATNSLSVAKNSGQIQLANIKITLAYQRISSYMFTQNMNPPLDFKNAFIALSKSFSNGHVKV